MLIDGLHVPLPIPFARDGRLFLSKLEANVRRYSLSPAAGLVALAPNSEAGSLSDAEARDVLDAVGSTAAAEKVLVAGISKNSVVQALTIAALAEQSGFDAVLLAAPPRWPEMLRHSGSPAEIFNFFRTVADNSPLPVLLWSDTATPWLGFSVETVASLASHPNILGVYDADLTPARLRDLLDRTRAQQFEARVTSTFRPVTRRMQAANEASAGQGSSLIPAAAIGSGAPVATPRPAIKTRSRRLSFQIMSTGPASQVPELLAAGLHGYMPALAAPAPQSCHEVLAAFSDGDPALAAERASRLTGGDTVLTELGPAAVAYACDLNGYYGGVPRLPLAMLSAQGRSRVDAALRDLKN